MDCFLNCRIKSIRNSFQEIFNGFLQKFLHGFSETILHGLHQKSLYEFLHIFSKDSIRNSSKSFSNYSKIFRNFSRKSEISSEILPKVFLKILRKCIQGLFQKFLGSSRNFFMESVGKKPMIHLIILFKDFALDSFKNFSRNSFRYFQMTSLRNIFKNSPQEFLQGVL